LLVLLKVFQHLHYFPPIDTIPAAVVEHIRVAADFGRPLRLPGLASGSVTVMSIKSKMMSTTLMLVLAVVYDGRREAHAGTHAGAVHPRSARSAAPGRRVWRGLNDAGREKSAHAWHRESAGRTARLWDCRRANADAVGANSRRFRRGATSQVSRTIQRIRYGEE
jgi:hypothetical protein